MEEMDAELEEMTERFRELYADFAGGCAGAEEDGRWNGEEYGSMEGYAFAALSGAILSLIVSDGNVGERETELLNRNFGFDYTVDGLLELYGYAARDILSNAAENAGECARLIDKTDEELGKTFRDLLLLACDILSRCEDGVSEAESETVEKLKKAIA
ncbi:MAG: hypothetical protein II680_12295 [Clostridia bacterium]|nr:hypothetical protein [Clostridia bacterium]